MISKINTRAHARIDQFAKMTNDATRKSKEKYYKGELLGLLHLTNGFVKEKPDRFCAYFKAVRKTYGRNRFP